MKNKVMQLMSLILLLLPAGFLAGKSAPDTSPKIVPEVVYGGAYVVFAGKFGGEITRQEIGANSEVQVEGCAKGSRVYQFTLSVTKNGKKSTFTNRSASLSAEMIASLKSLSKGDSFEFQHTKAYLPNSTNSVDVHGRIFIVV